MFDYEYTPNNKLTIPVTVSITWLIDHANYNIPTQLSWNARNSDN